MSDEEEEGPQNLFHPDPEIDAAVSKMIDLIESAKAELPKQKRSDFLDLLQDYLINQWEEGPDEDFGASSDEEAAPMTA